MANYLQFCVVNTGVSEELLELAIGFGRMGIVAASNVILANEYIRDGRLTRLRLESLLDGVAVAFEIDTMSK